MGALDWLGDVFGGDGPDAPAPAGPAPQQGGGGLGAKWSAFLAHPENAAMLTQAGIELLAPRSPGHGSVGAAVLGGAMGARDRVIQGRNTAREQARTAALEERGADQRDRALSVDEQNANTSLIRALDPTGSGGQTANNAATNARQIGTLYFEQLQNAKFMQGEAFNQAAFDADFRQSFGALPSELVGRAAAPAAPATPAGTTLGQALPGAAASVPEGTVIQANSNPNAKFVMRNGQWIPQ